MLELEKKSLDSPDERRTFDKGTFDVAKLEQGSLARATLDPGWRWSECVKPIAQTPSCQVTHHGYIVSGRMKVVMDDGAEAEFGPGDALHIEPGHDAWTLGNEKCVLIEVAGAERFAGHEH